MIIGKELPCYQCHKEVWALKIQTVEYSDKGAKLHPAEPGYAAIDVGFDYLQKHQPEVGGYYVVYADGYVSYSPAAPFESGYTLKA